jgi:hypothetical protein
MVEVVGTDEFRDWFRGLTDPERDGVARVVDMLEEAGIALGFPYSSEIRVSRMALRELRPKRGRSPLRVFYAFDPRRQAVLLLGGSKGASEAFYARYVPRAEAIWEEYLKEQEAGLHDEGGSR